MKTLAISDFKVRCIRVLKTVAKTKEPVIITLRGKPLVKIEPIEHPQGEKVLGGLQGSIRILGDIIHSDFADDWQTNGL